MSHFLGNPQRMRQKLYQWHRCRSWDLPWRQTQDPYAIVVSEFMLQQTRVGTVLPYYEAWMARFPTWDSLASAAEEEVLRAWEGLGYYRRAANLHKLARWVAAQPGKLLPEDPAELEKLPGIGPYTARAIALFVFRRRELPWDSNLYRVFGRISGTDPRSFRQSSQSWVWELLPSGDKARDFVNAVMDLGRTVCLPRRPRCSLCPWERFCQTRLRGESFLTTPRQALRVTDEELALIESEGSYWVSPCQRGKRWQSFWCLPDWQTDNMTRLDLMGRFTYSVTRYRVCVAVWKAQWKGEPVGPGRWADPPTLEKLPLPRPHRRALALVQKDELLLESSRKR
ncbi:A/G-specific adenine glycosylase [Candidatus Methylacidithermus pantelleriae]|uniref:Adenine DNA glycosylase n=1 Tax=Candidatus Methylacidithermus pantelleriae TaxID=2744239 RepID=A0A8J2BIV9_9BACT|nr:hypothetical protein [Candidatus Methylacidithermus pantelleriae]CAF0695051.1 A/G-specific adenine glycosylase [Candidatus Methylacidithermus pantelleriae]